MKNYYKIAVAVYVLCGVTFFGHAWNRNWSQQVIDGGGQVLASLTAGGLWPLYASIVAWEK